MSGCGGRGGGQTGGGRLTRAQRQEEAEQNRTDVPRRNINISGCELPYADPGNAGASQHSNRHVPQRRKIPGTVYNIRVAASKNEICSKINAYLFNVAPPNTHFQDVNLTVKLSGTNTAYSSYSVIQTDGEWQLLLDTLEAQPKKGVQFVAEWTQARPPTPPPPTPTAPTSAASAAVAQPTHIAPLPTPASSSSTTTTTTTSGRGRGRSNPRAAAAAEQNELREAELEGEKENAIAIWRAHKRCDTCSRKHSETTHCFLHGGEHYILTPSIVTQWARMVCADSSLSILQPPLAIFEQLHTHHAAARGAVATAYRNSILAGLPSGGTSLGSATTTTTTATPTSLDAATSASDGTAAAAASLPLQPSNQNQQRFTRVWTVWGFDKRSGGLNSDLVIKLYEKGAKTMRVLAGAKRDGVIESDFPLTRMEMVIVREWIDEWGELDEEESVEERAQSQKEVLAAIAAARGEVASHT